MVSLQFLDNLTETQFRNISIALGCIFIVIMIFWVLINHKVFKWRPFTEPGAILCLSIGIERTSIFICSLVFLWNFLYFLPYILLIIYGAICAAKVEPYTFGLIFIFSIPSLIAIFSIYQYYKVNCYILKTPGKVILTILLVIIFGMSALLLFLPENRNYLWQSCGFFLSWPSIFILGVIVTSRRQRLADPSSLVIPESPDFHERILSNQTIGTDRFLWFDYIILIIFSALISVLYYFLFDKNDVATEMKNATLATGILFFCSDMILVFIHAFKHNTVMTLSTSLVILVLKNVAVLFSSQYWFAGHGVILFILLCILLTKFLFDVWCYNKYKVLDIKCEQIVDNLVLMTHGKRRVQLSEVIYEMILLIILCVLIIVDFVLSWKFATLVPLSFNYNGTVENTISQESFSLFLVILGLCLSFSIAGILIMYQQNGHIDTVSFIFFIISLVLVVVLPSSIPLSGNGTVCVTLKSTTSVTVISIVAAIIVLIPTMFIENLTVFHSISEVCKCTSYESEVVVFWGSIVSFVATVIDLIIPFALKDCSFLGIVIVSAFFAAIFLLSFCGVIFYNDYLTSSGYVLQLVMSIIATICFSVGVGGMTGNYYNAIIAFLAFGFVECVCFGFAYDKFASWGDPVRSVLFLIIPSAVLAVGSLILTVLSSQVIAPSILLFVFTSFFFASVLYLVLRKSGYKVNIGSIITAVVMAICLIAILVYIGIELKSAFLVFTIICFSVFIVCFLALCSVLAVYSESNSLVFTELFFPIYTYSSEKTLGKMAFLNALFVLCQIIPYIWGVFGTIFFTEQQYSFLGLCVSLGLMSVICCLLICTSDKQALFSLEYSTQEILQDVLASVRGVDSIAQNPSIEDLMEGVSTAKELRDKLDGLAAARGAHKKNSMLFNSQLTVSTQAKFEYTKQFLYTKYQDKIPGLDYLLSNSNWSAKERREIFSIYDASKQQDLNEQAALMYYQFIEQQAKERIRLLNERDKTMGADTIILPADIDPDAARLIQAELEMQRLKDEIKQKEQENYRLQKLAERRRAELAQRRLEEERRRKQEEEEERRRIQQEKNKEIAERRRKQAEERRRQEEERRRREEQEAEEERKRLEEQRRKAQQDADEMRKRLQSEESRRQQELLRSGLSSSANNAGDGANQYQAALNKLIKAGVKFNDPMFHPNKMIKECPKITEKLQNAEWNRLEDRQKGIIDTITQDRFMQGQLGDCYFIAALSALAQDPRMIENMFDKPVSNQAYIHSVKFHRMGKTDHVAVDTVVPAYKSSHRNCFINFDDRSDSYWPAIVEKAFAKYFGSYSAIDGGNSHTAMYYLTGEFPYRVNLKKDKTLEEIRSGELWRKLYNWRKLGAFLCAGSYGRDDSKIDSLGIVQGHAYTILGMYEVQNTPLFKIRNTWGDTEWKGDWSDNSKKLTPALKQRLGIEAKDDGVFMMSFKDFTAHFETIYILIRTANLHRYELRTTFRPGELDGAKPNDRGDMLRQWRFVFTQPTTMYVLYEKTSCSSLHQVQMKKTDEKFKNHYVGDTVLHEGVVVNSEVSSWIWNITEYDQPWFFLPYRERADDVVDVCIQVYTDVPVQCEKFD